MNAYLNFPTTELRHSLLPLRDIHAELFVETLRIYRHSNCATEERRKS